MKRLPFNTITVLWGIVIFLASCAFTTKTQKAQSEQVQQKQEKVPTPQFLEKVQASKKDFIINGKIRSSYYDFRALDFEDYEKPTFENLFTTYGALFGLGEHDEMKPLHPVQYMKALPHINQKACTTRRYQYLHKGFPVYLDNGLDNDNFYKIDVYGDSTGKYIWRVSSIIFPNLDVDTTIAVSSKEAFKTAKAVIPIKEDEIFIFEQSVTVIPEEQRNQITIPDINFKIYQGRLAYSYLFATRKDVLPLVPYKTYEVFVDVQTNKVLHLKKPLHANHLATPIAENKNKEDDCKLLIENEVEYTVENPIISGANNEFLEFDINVASLLNNEDFYSGEMLIDYNSLTFGTNLASSGRITLTKGTVITTPNYTLSIVDVSPDQMKITAQSTPSTPSNYYTITNQSEELAHIKIDISNLAGNTGIEFDEIQMQGLSELFDASINSNTPFDLVVATDELDIDINGILNSSDTCTTCTGGVLVQAPPCPTVTCPCPASTYTDMFEFAGTHYYQCKEIPFKDCDATDNILLWANRPNENIQLYIPSSTSPLGTPMEWCRISSIITLSEDQLVEANAMYSVETSNSYFNTVFGINSFDSAGTQQRVELFPNSTQSSNQPFNFNPGEQVLNLGRGVTGVCGPMVSLDIVSHEYTHGVLNHHIKISQNHLAGQALQESLADIFSAIIRHDESGGLQNWGGHTIWSIGEEACTNYSEVPRHFNAPQTSKRIQAAYYQDTTKGWNADTTQTNLVWSYNHAGVPTLWFYLLSQGGTGVYGDAVTGIGVDNAEVILVKALILMKEDLANTVYTFEDFRDFTLQAVIDLPAPNGICTPRHKSVVDAWIAVGLLDCDNLDVSFVETTPTPDPCVKTLTAKVENGSGCYTYEWFKIVGGVDSALNINNHTINVICDNVYKVKVTDTYLGCDVTKNRSVFATNTRKVEELNLNVSIRPTLANNQIFFDLEIEEPTTITISIFDQLGRRISQPIVSEKVYQGNRTIQHNVENLSSGIYFVSIETPKGKIVKKFVKM